MPDQESFESELFSDEDDEVNNPSAMKDSSQRKTPPPVMFMKAHTGSPPMKKLKTGYKDKKNTLVEQISNGDLDNDIDSSHRR